MTPEQKAVAIIKRANERLLLTAPHMQPPVFAESPRYGPVLHALIAAVADELLDQQERCRQDYIRLNDRILKLEIKAGV